MVVWLEEGNAASGWKHILKHKSEKPFAGKSDQTIQNIVFDTIKNPSKLKQSVGERGNCYYKTIENKIVKTVVANNGYIVTSHTISTNIDKNICK